ncbi:MAG: hypothetical protein K6A05_06680 [Lachnospiraceae bacterium]|nr:hypothetical protein [Lachnospiraceae bacterium]
MKKRLLSILVAATMVCSMAACQTKEEEVKEELPSAEEVSDYAQLSVKQLEVRTYENDSQAAYYLGLFYDYGYQDVTQNFAKALDWYQKAVELGDARGNVGLGYLYLNGCGVEADYDMAAEYFETAIDEGLSDGYVGLARIGLQEYENSLGVYVLDAWDDLENSLYLESHSILPEKETEESVEKSTATDAEQTPEETDSAPSVSVKDSPEYMALSERILEGNDTYGERIYSNLKEANNMGNLDALYYMGYIQEHGIGCERDIEAAIVDYKAVASNTSTNIWDQYAINSAHTRLGILYMGGKWTTTDEDAAFNHFLAAAENGYAMAEYYMGILYQMGLGTDKDYETALSWFEQAAEQDYAPAICQLGYIYFNGIGVETNLEQAVYYQKLAAAQGYVPAQINLGYMYENGYGVDQNLETALAYYKLAEASDYEGVPEAIARVELLLKDM